MIIFKCNLLTIVLDLTSHMTENLAGHLEEMFSIDYL